MTPSLYLSLSSHFSLFRLPLKLLNYSMDSYCPDIKYSDKATLSTTTHVCALQNSLIVWVCMCCRTADSGAITVPQQ